MRRWLILTAFGLANLASSHLLAQNSSAAPGLPADSEAQMPDAVKSPDSFRDSIGRVSIRPVPDVAEDEPLCFVRVEYLRKHNDYIMAISYLRELVTNGNLRSQYRARAILELADCLDHERQPAEALCWLKIWAELYPARPEFGAVAYRTGSLYSRMGLPDLARDAFYLALAHSVNDAQVHDAEDVQRYMRLTEGTLWAMAANEYENGQWARGAELFIRYRKEAMAASPLSLEKAAFLQADCYYQLKQVDKATSLYEETLKQHPFNPLAPEARLRLYHLYVLQKQPDKARDELEALAWTVRTVWPKDETFWQKQTAQLLLTLNQKDTAILPPLVKQSAQLSPQGKTWQETLNHYDALVSYEAGTTQATVGGKGNSSPNADALHGLPEEEDLLAMNRSLNQLLPTPRTASTQ